MFEALSNTLMSLGDIVGRGFRTFRQQIALIFSILFLPSFLSQLSMAGLHFDFMSFVHQHNIGFNLIILVIIALGCLMLNIFAQWQTALRSVAIVRMVVNAPLSYPESLKHILPKQPKLIAIFLLSSVLPLLVLSFWGGIDLALCLIWPSNPFGVALFRALLIVDLAATLVSLSFVLLWCFISFSVLACEDYPLGEILIRSFRLTRQGLWRGCLFMLLLVVSITALQSACRLPLIIVSVTDVVWRGIPDVQTLFKSGFHTSMAVSAIAVFLESLVSVLVCGIGCVTFGVYFYDLRQRIEGTDLLNKIAVLQNDGHRPAL